MSNPVDGEQVTSLNGRPRALMVALLSVVILSAIPFQATAQGRILGPMTPVSNAFPAWHQGFESGLEGWYGSETGGPLGWCGEIRQVRDTGPKSDAIRPSAGRGYATLRADACNAFWTGLGVPLGIPYAPGPEQSLYSSRWPGRYVTELDVYLDPAWSGVLAGNFGALNGSPQTVLDYAITVFPTAPDADPFHTGPHYMVSVDAVEGEQALSIAGRRIDEAGWYTFRFVVQDDGGVVRVDFELEQRPRGLSFSVENVAPVDLLGPFKLPFGEPPVAAEYGSGHVWFFDIPFGLELAIDQHRVRRGR